MICRQCQADLRHVNMRAEWSGGDTRVFTLALECPHCAALYQLSGVLEQAFITLEGSRP